MRTVLLVLALALACAACGEQERPATSGAAGSTDAQKIRDVLERYESALRANDAEAACAVLSRREVLDELKAFGSTCPAVFGEAIAEAGRDYKLTTTSIRIRGDRAFTKGTEIETDGTSSGDQVLVRERGRWLMTTHLEAPS